MESAKAQVEQQYHRQKIKDSLEIKKAKTNRIRKVVNRDEGNLVKASKWTLLCKTNLKRSQDEDLTSNLETVFNSI